MTVYGQPTQTVVITREAQRQCITCFINSEIKDSIIVFKDSIIVIQESEIIENITDIEALKIQKKRSFWIGAILVGILETTLILLLK